MRVIPRVMVSVPDERRRIAVTKLLGRLPDPMGLLQVALAEETAGLIVRQLMSDEPERPP